MSPLHWTCLVFGVLSLVYFEIHASGVFELKLESFKNSEGLASQATCCQGVLTNGRCQASCKTFFRICLKHFQADISADQPCTFGSEITPVMGANSFQFPDSFQSFTNPIRLPFDFTWPGTFSLIIEAWHDKSDTGPTQGSPRELIIQIKTQRSVEVGSTWTTFESTGSKKLTFTYRVICDEFYYGVGCSEMCKPRDDKFGHYRCTANGTMSCLHGYMGPYCDKAICLPACNEEHGYCDEPNECKCRLGWQGRYCDKCIPYPGCQHGTCDDQPWQCNCAEGWGGLFCNQDMNYCTHHKPCRNGATCTNTGMGSYTCECAVGYSGTNCEMQVDDCLHQPCHHGGTCRDKGAVYECECPVGFHGLHCESSARSCEELPCQNGATCLLYADTYKCVCLAGYTGVNCEREIDECGSHPCQNGGRCIDERNGFRCVCPSGWSGGRCDENTNDCSMEPCLNAGTCIDKVNDFECECAAGYYGALCQHNVNDCLNWPCANGGTCHDLTNSFTCDCARGFTGRDCRININECESQPCRNGAMCQDQVNDYQCRCTQNYYGKQCEFYDGLQTTGVNVRVANKSYKEPPIMNIQQVPEVSKEKRSVVSMQQLMLIICLGVGIPIIIIIVIIIFLLCNRKQHMEASNVSKENAHNELNSMNNKSRSIETTIINAIPPSNVCSKITNHQDTRSLPQKTVNTEVNQKNLMDNKHYNKDLLVNHNNDIKQKHMIKTLNNCYKNQQQDPNSINNAVVDNRCRSSTRPVLLESDCQPQVGVLATQV